MTARLPDELVAHDSIAEMEIGDEGWMVPWGMSVDEQQGCWLNGKYTVAAEPHGTSTMRVRRAFVGYFVTLPDGQAYTPGPRNRWTTTYEHELIAVEGFDEPEVQP